MLEILFDNSVNEWLIYWTPNEQFFSYIIARASYIRWDDEVVRCVLDQYAQLDFYSASWLKQQYTDKHVCPLWHIILIQSQPVFALTPYNYMLSREAAHTNIIVFDLTRRGLDPTIYHTQGKQANHYNTDVVWYLMMLNSIV